MSEPRIDGDRLWQTIVETGRIGGTSKGGVSRLALTDLDRQVRDWFVASCREAGCAVTIDDMGSIVAVRPGRDAALAPIACGSHLDTQPTGGRFDGILGVLAGLEVVRALNDAGVETEAPLAVIDWTNEEGSRFAPGMMASGVFAGKIAAELAHAATDRDGHRFGDELDRIGYRGTASAASHRLAAYFELHIEQGPILEAEGLTIGVVTGAQGLRWYDIALTGRESHAGTTPLPLRRDALLGAARVIESVHEIARRHGPHAVGTVGDLAIAKPSRNVVPGQVTLTVDVRHPDDGVLTLIDGELRSAVARIAEAGGLTASVEEVQHTPPVDFDAGCVETVRTATQRLGYGHRDMISGAGHDACYAALKVPTAMVFIPCENGISHNESENASPADVTAGASVLLHAMLTKAG